MKSFLLMILALILILIAIPVVFILNFARILYRKESLNNYFFTVAIGLDQLGGSVLYQEEDWTVSSRTYYLAEYKNNKYSKVFMKFIDFLFGLNHCKNSFKWEFDRNKEL